MGCWSTSATRTPTRTTRSGRCARGARSCASSRSLNPRLEAEHGVRLQARVGIHTGPVVVGEMGGGRDGARRWRSATRSNVAARLEAFAEPDTVVISDATLRPRGGALRHGGPGHARAQGHLRADPRLPGAPAERGREPPGPRARAHALRGARAGAGALARPLRAGAGATGPGGLDRGRGGDREVAPGAPAARAAARDARTAGSSAAARPTRRTARSTR